MLVISDECIPFLPSSHARVLLRLLLVSSESSCPSLLCSEARHHFALMQGITSLSCSALPGKRFQRWEARFGRRGNEDFPEEGMKTFRTSLFLVHLRLQVVDDVFCDFRLGLEGVFRLAIAGDDGDFVSVCTEACTFVFEAI